MNCLELMLMMLLLKVQQRNKFKNIIMKKPSEKMAFFVIFCDYFFYHKEHKGNHKEHND